MAAVPTNKFVWPCVPLWFQAAGLVVRRKGIIEKNNATGTHGRVTFIDRAEAGSSSFRYALNS